MRNLLLSLLMASALTPAAVDARDGGMVGFMRAQGERSTEKDARGEDRQQRRAVQNVDRPTRVETSQHVDQGNDVDRVERTERTQRTERRSRDRVQVEGSEAAATSRRTESRGEGVVGAYRQIGTNMIGDRSERIDRDRRDDRQDGRRGDNDRRGDHDRQVWRRGTNDRDGDHNRRDWRRGDNGRHDWNRHDGDRREWSRNWRDDRRYDWSNYRITNRSIFRLGSYYDPYGWGYRRMTVGYSLRPYYYRSNYWLNDPFMYRLPPAYGPYRWVRYYDDALLVNVYTGFVVDVVHNFFW